MTQALLEPRARDIALPGSAPKGGNMLFCNKCVRDRVPDGGCHMSPTRWYCSHCFKNFNQRKFK